MEVEEAQPQEEKEVEELKDPAYVSIIEDLCEAAGHAEFMRQEAGNQAGGLMRVFLP